MTPKPGRELDALVAEKVMRWTTYEKYVHGPLMHGGGMMTLYKGDGASHNGFTWSVEGFKPFTDIAAAWEVVEKLLGLGYTLELYSPGALINDEFSTHSVGWGAEFCTWGEPYLRSGRVGKTVCHTMDEEPGGAAIETTHEAICLAALKALE